MKFYLIGIGGAGMNVVARLLRARGHEVSGSDRTESATTDALVREGIAVFVGHDAANVPADAIVVRSTAITPANPEYAIALDRGQEVWHRSQALAFASEGQDFIAVAGAHGKTSTSGMLAVAFDSLGLDPSRAIGGTLAGGAAGGYLGTGDVLIAEADESDGSFLNYSPRVAMVTNIEPDHLDHYGSVAAFEQAFVDFAHRIVPGGLLVVCTDSPGGERLANAVASDLRIVTYGRRPRSGDHVLLELAGEGWNITRGDVTVRLRMSVPGDHMALNASGAWAVGVELGIDATEMADALGLFRGTGRRFEDRGEAGGVRVIDDYAHHPTEVEATIRTALEQTSGRVIVLFQPHLYSRTEKFAREFAAALDLADDVVVTSVYAAREVPSDGVEGDSIVAHSAKATYIADKHEAAREVARRAAVGDIVITMGAGDVTLLGPEILAEMSAR